MTMEYLHPWPRGDGAILAGNGEARLSAQAGKNKALPTRPGEGSAYFPCRRRGSLGPDGRSPIPPAQVTLVDGGDAATVLSPGGLVAAEHRRTLLAVADRRDPVGRDARGNQVALHAGGAALAQGQVVLAGAPLVGMTLDGHRHVRVQIGRAHV